MVQMLIMIKTNQQWTAGSEVPALDTKRDRYFERTLKSRAVDTIERALYTQLLTHNKGIELLTPTSLNKIIQKLRESLNGDLGTQ